VVFTANHLTVTDKQKLNINHKNTHINTIQIKENRQLNIQKKQKYSDSVASYDTQPGNEVGLFYNGPKHHTGLFPPVRSLNCHVLLEKCYQMYLLYLSPTSNFIQLLINWHYLCFQHIQTSSV